MKRRCRSWKSLIPLVLAVILLGISVNTGILPVLADPAEENAQNAFAQEIPAALPEEVEGEGEMKGAAKEALADAGIASGESLNDVVAADRCGIVMGTAMAGIDTIAATNKK